MQAVCASSCFLCVSIKYPGSTSVFFAFEQSHIKTMLEKEGFLHPSYCLFGDTAYINTPYMYVPFRNIPPGCSEDAFIFFNRNFASTLNVHLEFLCIILESYASLFRLTSRSRKPPLLFWLCVNCTIISLNKIIVALNLRT